MSQSTFPLWIAGDYWRLLEITGNCRRLLDDH